jgi:hypothetical protein
MRGVIEKRVGKKDPVYRIGKMPLKTPQPFAMHAEKKKERTDG